jgi:3-methylcrotonyl-CoA carboxylase alpha subunit
VASGEALPKRQDELSITGWAMEARLYAEDPSKGFLPSTGPLKYFQLPPTSRKQPKRLRIETGFQAGDEISPHYDPMIAKLIVHAESRDAAARKLALDCSYVTCWPVKTNAEFLWQALENKRFRAADLDTALLEDQREQIVPSGRPSENALQSVAGRLLEREAEEYLSKGNSLLDGIRINAARRKALFRLEANGETFEIEYDPHFTEAGRYVDATSEGYLVNDLGSSYMFNFWRPGGTAGPGSSSGTILSPMPGRIIAVEVAQGQTVTKGQKLLTLEAMKMEHSLTAPFDGVVAELNAEVGAQVQVEALLVRVEAVGE